MLSEMQLRRRSNLEKIAWELERPVKSFKDLNVRQIIIDVITARTENEELDQWTEENYLVF